MTKQIQCLRLYLFIDFLCYIYTKIWKKKNNVKNHGDVGNIQY